MKQHRRTVLYALDAEPECLQGLEQVAAWVQREDHDLKVAHVVETDDPSFELDDTARELIGQALDSIGSEGVELRLRTGRNVPESLCEAALELDADLLVVMTGDQGALRRWIFGSVASDVLRECHCPVLVLHAGDEVSFDGNVLLPVAMDGLDGSTVEGFLGWAGSAGKMHLLHVEPAAVPTVTAGGEMAAPAILPVTRTEEELLAVVKDYSVGEIEVEASVLRGMPVPSIVESAQRLDASLIVMGTSGPRGIDRLLLGSVAAQTLVRAPCPVLVVPTGGSADRRRRFRRPVEVLESTLPGKDKKHILETWRLDEQRYSESDDDGMKLGGNRADLLRELDVALESLEAD